MPANLTADQVGRRWFHDATGDAGAGRLEPLLGNVDTHERRWTRSANSANQRAR